jgi:hypothetical protein
MKQSTKNTAAFAWLALGGLLALGFSLLIAREMPSIRREWRLMRM